MKKVKNYIEADLAKRKIARYDYWSVKDDRGAIMRTSDGGQEFGSLLDSIIADNVDSEVSVKYGNNEQASRQNPPLFIRVNESIEWVEPEPDDTVTINGVPHKVDKQGNVNINFTGPNNEEPRVEPASVDLFRQEMEMQLSGIRREHELKEEKMALEMQNKLLEQTLKFKEMMVGEREARVAEREREIARQEAFIEERETEVRDDVRGYVRQLPSALGGLIKDLLKDPDRKGTGLAGTGNRAPVRSRAVFEIVDDEEEGNGDIPDELEGENQTGTENENEEDEGIQRDITDNGGGQERAGGEDTGIPRPEREP